MKRWIKKFMTVVIAGSVILSVPGELCEAKTISSELSEICYPGENVICYDCGNRTEDGVIEIVSNSNSLKVGDIVEIELFYNAEKSPYANDGLYAIDWSILYDNDVLGNVTKDVGATKNLGNPNLIVMEEQGFIAGDFTFLYRDSCLMESSSIVKLRFDVKKNVPSTKIYCSDIMMFYYDSIVEIDYTNIYNRREPSEPVWSDVLTIEIEDKGNTGTTGNSFALSAPSKEAPAGSDIIIPFNITSNPGINALGITVTYDQNMCDYKNMAIADRFKNLISLDSVYKVLGEGKVKLSFIAKNNITDIGTFANLSLKLKDGVAEGSTANVAVTIEQVTNKEEMSVTGTGANAKITVKAAPQEVYTLGDVSEDGRIDLTDAIFILLNYNEEKVLTDAQRKVADVNKDNVVDLMDALQILKYFNGEIRAF